MSGLTALTGERISAFARVVEVLGWECIQAEVNTHAGTARLSFRRFDGLLVTLDADALGRASLTREWRREVAAAVGRRGDRCVVDRLSSEFIGRSRFADAPAALRALANYIADNAGVDRQLAAGTIATLLGAA